MTVANHWTVEQDPAVDGWGCVGRLAECGAANALDGRATFRSESQPSTFGGSCPDGTVAASSYYPYPYVEAVLVETVGGEPLDAGRPVRATVSAWGEQAAGDAVDLYYATDATSPSWSWIGTTPFNYIPPSTPPSRSTGPSRAPTRTAPTRYGPVGRRGGAAAPCTTGDHDDHDDVAFEVGDHGRPAVQLTSPAPGASVSGLVTLGADAASALGVARVEFFVNGLLAGTDTTAPYTAELDGAR